MPADRRPTPGSGISPIRHGHRGGHGEAVEHKAQTIDPGVGPMTSFPAPGIGGSPRPEGVRLQPTSTRRRPALAVASALLVVVCTAVIGIAFAHAGQTSPVLAVTQTLAPGSIIQRSDLQVVDVHVPGAVPVVSASEESAIIGRQTADALQAGSLLIAADTVAAYAPPPGTAEVGVAVAAGQLPAGGVTAGEHVDVVVTGAPGAGAGAAVQLPGVGASSDPPGTVVVSDVSVLSVAEPSASSATTSDLVVSILVPVADAPTVAALSAAGDGALVVVASGS